MALHVIRYTLKPERVEENERLCRGVYEALRGAGIEGLRYATYKLDDGVSFMHVVDYAGEGTNPMTLLPAFKAFSEGVRERCEVPPQRSALTEIGSHGWR